MKRARQSEHCEALSDEELALLQEIDRLGILTDAPAGDNIQELEAWRDRLFGLDQPEPVRRALERIHDASMRDLIRSGH